MIGDCPVPLVALHPLNLKLLRDLWRIRMQGIAIALVIASGAALLIMSLTTIEALEETTAAYYDRQRFADVFASLKRGPERLLDRIAEIPGVQAAESRIVQTAILDIPDFPEPAIARLVSLPDSGGAVLNVPVLRAGRLVDSGRPDEAVIAEPFAEAHGLRPGDRLDAVMKGRKRSLLIVGTALSPEYIYAIPPGGIMPDERRFGVMWMGRPALASAFDLDGAFNDVALGLSRGTEGGAVIRALDALLAGYGGAGAYPRAEQISNWFLQNEIAQQKNMARLLPAIFLSVSAFLTHMVMARLIATERREIGLLKAFGYADLEIGWHYLKVVLAIGSLGIVLGSGAGAWLGHLSTEIYAKFYRFPFLLYRPGIESFVLAGAVSLAAAASGSLSAVARAVSLPPAEAMRPAAPAIYRRGRLAQSALARALDGLTRMIFRRLLRWPLRAGLASAGLGLSIAVLILALQWLDAVDALVDTYFVRDQHQDATIGFYDVKPLRVVADAEGLSGVLAADPFRTVAARISRGPVSRREALIGVPAGAALAPVSDITFGALEPPPDGLLMSAEMARTLSVGVGDSVRIEVLEGRRPIIDMPVVRIFDTYIGKPVFMRLEALNRMMGDGRTASGLQLAIDPAGQASFLSAIKDLPSIAAVSFRRAAIKTFYDTLGQTMYIFVGFFVGFATTLSIGVTYNMLRIAVSERARELATLRVLGFSRAEISYILLGEIGIVVWLAVPFGCVAGYLLAWYFASAFGTELFRVPLVVEPSTYAQAALIALTAACLCAVVVRRQLDRLDLIAVLKTRE